MSRVRAPARGMVPQPPTGPPVLGTVADLARLAREHDVDLVVVAVRGGLSSEATKRLLDGQFVECGLTLQELHDIEDSLVKSLTAVYHSRIKYPNQLTA